RGADEDRTAILEAEGNPAVEHGARTLPAVARDTQSRMEAATRCFELRRVRCAGGLSSSERRAQTNAPVTSRRRFPAVGEEGERSPEAAGRHRSASAGKGSSASR